MSQNSQNIKQIIQSLDGLSAVEELITQKFASDAQLLTEIPLYLLELGGKRIRPVLCLLCAQALGLQNASQPLLDVAAGIELIHMATLLHDDIIDKSAIRRHEASPFVKFGLTNTLLSGDFLLVRAFSLCARLDRYIIDQTERACVELTEGEIMELPLCEKGFTLDESLTISLKKTASLFRLAAGSAAFIATEGHRETVTSFEQFGESLGIAFQVLDDVLDVSSTEEQLGKKSGIDIREKKPSPVNVLWLQSGSALAKKLLLSKDEVSENSIEEALNELRGSKVIEDAKAIATNYANSALSALEIAQQSTPSSNNSSAYSALETLANYVLTRVQ